MVNYEKTCAKINYLELCVGQLLTQKQMLVDSANMYGYNTKVNKNINKIDKQLYKVNNELAREYRKCESMRTALYSY